VPELWPDVLDELRRIAEASSGLYGVRLGGNQFRDSDQAVGDEIQQKCSGDTSNAAVLGLAHCAMLFAPAEDTFDHLSSLLRLVITPMPRRAAIDRASSPLAGFGRALVLRHMRRDADGTQVFDMVFRVIGLVRADRNAVTNGCALCLRLPSNARASLI
jgi:hypothetical protein